MLAQNRGHIVGISSIQGKISIPYRSACECWLVRGDYFVVPLKDLSCWKSILLSTRRAQRFLGFFAIIFARTFFHGQGLVKCWVLVARWRPVRLTVSAAKYPRFCNECTHGQNKFWFWLEIKWTWWNILEAVYILCKNTWLKGICCAVSKLIFVFCNHRSPKLHFFLTFFLPN